MRDVWFIRTVLISLLLIAGCGGQPENDAGNGSGGRASDDDGTNGGSATGGRSNAGTGGSTNAGSGGANGCGMPNEMLPGDNECPEYVNCTQSKCGNALSSCYGAGYESGDFSGGACETYLSCLADCSQNQNCDSTCIQGCTPDSGCQTCLLNTFGGCVQRECLSEIQECAGGEFPGGEIPMLPDKGCADLLACCETLDATMKADCISAHDILKSSGDLACAAGYLTFAANGACE